MTTSSMAIRCFVLVLPVVWMGLRAVCHRQPRSRDSAFGSRCLRLGVRGNHVADTVLQPTKRPGRHSVRDETGEL